MSYLKEKTADHQFILGIDIGNTTSAISYFDLRKKAPQTIDISGGYGRLTMPTVVQYLEDFDEWVFGDYAVTNQGMGNEVIITDFLDKIGKNTFVQIKGKDVSIVDILALFIEEFMAAPINTNPKAEIAGIVVSIPDDFSAEALNDFKSAFEKAGFLDKIIDFVGYNKSVFAHYYYQRRQTKENLIMLDFGSRGVSGTVYNVATDKITPTSYTVDKSLGTKEVEGILERIFIDCYLSNRKITATTYQERANIKTMVDQYKDAIFQKNLLGKTTKIYFNFAHPAFEFSLSKDGVSDIIAPFRKEFKKFLLDLVKSSKEGLDLGDIDTVVCTGGGFEMDWVFAATEDMFPDSNIKVFKNAKVIAAEGASIIAAGVIGVISKDNIKLEKLQQIHLEEDIGIFLNKGFMPIIEGKNFSPYKKYGVMVIVAQKTDVETTIEILKRDRYGNFEDIGELKLPKFKRPAKATKLKLFFEVNQDRMLQIRAVDMGFGELFAPSGFDMIYDININ